MSTSYQDQNTAKKYLEFINSENGRLQQEILFKAVEPFIEGQKILDAACGNGWLAGKLGQKNLQAQGCDFSAGLIEAAKKNFPSLEFELADVTQSLPYADKNFDTVIFNMAAHDVSDLNKAFSELTRVLKKDGLLIMTAANPYYSFPVGVWKRGWLGFLLRKKPILKLRSYFSFLKKERGFVWNESFSSYFYTLPQYLNTAKESGLEFVKMQDIRSPSDGQDFNLRYQLFRFPVIILLVFKKPAE